MMPLRRTLFRKFVSVSLATSVLSFVRAQQAHCSSTSAAAAPSAGSGEHTEELRRLRTENAQFKQAIYADEAQEIAELRRENEFLKSQHDELEKQGKKTAMMAQDEREAAMMPFDDLVIDLFERPLWLSRESSLMREFDRAFNSMGLFPWDMRQPFTQGAFSTSGPLVSLDEMHKDVEHVKKQTEAQLVEKLGEDVKCDAPTHQSYATVDIDGEITKSVALRCQAESKKTGKKGDVQLRASIKKDGEVCIETMMLDGKNYLMLGAGPDAKEAIGDKAEKKKEPQTAV